ncbi:helix-turn-helix domain-containing protein [Cognatitamlana onchidii]|uniref:LuxR C-terminal-related transcriptional regulator n=1 Tax=Cognatitamlana onchidii TaxID=2562860 RepID=UPI0010A6555E|nr:LuxR C-terminal-related transcriptional regulator [Algibacter onchidii]
MKQKDVCFVIMPFGGYFDEYYNNIYYQAIKELGLTSFRADDIYKPSTIVKDIWGLIQSSSIIIADLTRQNANVFYELGLAHASKKPVILISESIDDVPFDLRALRVITYDKNDSDWGGKLKRKIKKSIKETLESPLKAVVPGFLEVENNTKVPRKTIEFLELRNEIDLLKRQLNSKGHIKTSLPNDIESMIIDKTEKEILILMGFGYSQKQMADKMTISLSAIEKRIKNLKQRTNSNSTAELVRFARDLGII